MSGWGGEPGRSSRDRGRGRGGRGRGWRGHHEDWGSDVPFPIPPDAGRGVEPWPSLQPNHMTSLFPCPPRYFGRGRGFVQPPLMAAPFHYPPPPAALYSHMLLRHPSTPPQHPNTLLWHPNTLPRHPTPHASRGKPLVKRAWEKVSDPKRVGQAPPTILTVMTYNVLAQSLIDKNMHLYRNTEALYWENRRELLLRELRDARADIVCLQEVEEEHYHTWFLPNMASLGYSGLYKKRTGKHSDGCAMFYSTSHLKLLEWRLVEFQRQVRVLDRDNVGLAAKFETSGSRQRSFPFCLATTHLLFNPKAGEVKLAQMACLLAELDQLATPPPGQPRLPCIVCGDLNSLPSSPLLTFLESGSLDYSGLRRDQIAGYQFRDTSQRQPIPAPLLPPEVPISHMCTFVSPSDDTPTPPTNSLLLHGTTYLSVYSSHSSSSSRGPSRDVSPSPGASSSSSDQPSPPAAKSFGGVHPPTHTGQTGPGLTPRQPNTSGGRTSGTPKSVTTHHLKALEMVDYIHYTPTGFLLLGRQSLISPHRLREMGPQPHHLLPSDHLWLLARLQIFPTNR